MPNQDVRVLAFHAAYRCHDSGVCCRSNWPIPIEADQLERAQRAMEARKLLPAHALGSPAFAYVADAPRETPAIVATCDGECVFHESTGKCAIHSALGHDALPLACRQFPRVTVI